MITRWLPNVVECGVIETRQLRIRKAVRAQPSAAAQEKAMNEAALERMGERDDAIFDRVGEDRSSAVSIEEIVRCGLRVSTVRSSLKRLMEQGLVERVWRGN